MPQVDSKLCEEKHRSIDRQLNETTKKIDEHDCSITELKDSSMKLTTIIELITSPSYNKSFWETDAGKKLITFFIVVGMAIVGSAIGVNILSYFK